jgi:pimeloyl-ACP methyl ester carboxylesterase
MNETGGQALIAFVPGAPGKLTGALGASREVIIHRPGAEVAAIAAAVPAGAKVAILAEPGGEAAALRLLLAAPDKVSALVLVAPAAAAEALGEEASRLAGVAVPTLLLFGRRDGVAPKTNGDGYFDLLPLAYVIHVYDAGHPPDAERLDAVLAVTRSFLDRPDSFTVNDRNEQRYA